MPDNRITYTPHLALSKLPANFHVWAQIMNDNLTAIDAAISGFVAFQNMRGAWANSTQYAAGDSVVDIDTAIVWRCGTTNLSSTIPRTFAEERALFPNYWLLYSTAGTGRGEWTGPGTPYAFNDFVSHQSKYAVCIRAHTSTASFDADVASGFWSVIVDVSGYLPLTGGTLTGPLIGTTASFTGNVSIKSTLTVTGPAGVNSGIVQHDDTHMYVRPLNTGGFLFLGGQNANTAFVTSVGIFPNTTNTALLGNAANVWGDLRTVTATLTGALTGTTASFSGPLNVLKPADATIGLRVAGLTRAMIVTHDTVGTTISGTDVTGTGSFQPLILNGSIVSLAAPLTGTTATFGGAVNGSNGFFTDTVAGGYVLHCFNNTNETGFTIPLGVRQGNNVGGTNFSELHVVHSAVNDMGIEVADQANTKGILRLQPFGGSVITGAPLSVNGALLGTSASFSGNTFAGTNGATNKLTVNGTNTQDSLIVTDTSGAKFFTFKPETSLDTATLGYVGGAGWGTIAFTSPITGTTANFTGTVTAASFVSGPGAQIQMVSTETGAAATGTTLIPFDSTIPQQTEGDQYMTLAITPKSATSKLIIEVVWIGSSSVGNNIGAVLFQDAGANAIAAGHATVATPSCAVNIAFRHVMTSGTTSAMTFKVRAGGSIAGTTFFNIGGTYGGVMASSIVITETA